MRSRQRGEAVRTILLAHTIEGLARSKRLPSPKTLIKRLDKPEKKRQDDGAKVVAMFRRLAAAQGDTVDGGA